MRFSIKWTLVTTAYAALVAAAFARPSDAFALGMWLVSLTAFCYALITAAISQERRRAITIGFAISSAVLMSCLYLWPLRAPWVALFRDVSKGGMGLRSVEEYQRMYRTIRPIPANPNNAVFMKNLETDYGQALRLQSLNAFCSLIAGVFGCVLGAAAFRNANPTSALEDLRILRTEVPKMTDEAIVQLVTEGRERCPQ